MDNSKKFYSQLFDMINNYFSDINNNYLLFIIKLSYYNTSSSKMLFDLLSLLAEYKDKEKDINIEWHFNNEDEEIQEDIEDLLYDIDIEGVSIIKSYRTQIHHILSTGTVDDLLIKLEKPAAEN